MGVIDVVDTDGGIMGNDERRAIDMAAMSMGSDPAATAISLLASLGCLKKDDGLNA